MTVLIGLDILPRRAFYEQLASRIRCPEILFDLPLLFIQVDDLS